MSNYKKIIYGLLALMAIIGATTGSGIYLFMNRPIQKGGIIYLDKDDTTDSVFYKLEKQLHTNRLTGLKLLASWRGYEENIKTGAYQFTPEETTWKIFSRLRNGLQTPVKLTLGSVRTLDRLSRNVSRQIMADSLSIIQLLTDSNYISKLGFTPATLPALFIPNTYEVYWNMDAEDFIKRMKREYDRFWTPQKRALADSIGLSPIEVATLASIVEEETANRNEKPMVAGLYLNRLKRNIPLQADPTIKFSLKEFGLRRILFKHLEVESPYNTYKYAGLPPGPIRIPSIEGLESVLNYTQHNYLYMCAKEDFSGTHNFASTLREHNINAQRYQQALNRRKVF